VKTVGNSWLHLCAQPLLQMTGNYFYPSLLGELYARGEKQKAIEHLQKPILLTGSVTERQVLQKRKK
jgi:hypothetical protein